MDKLTGIDMYRDYGTPEVVVLIEVDPSKVLPDLQNAFQKFSPHYEEWYANASEYDLLMNKVESASIRKHFWSSHFSFHRNIFVSANSWLKHQIALASNAISFYKMREKDILELERWRSGEAFENYKIQAEAIAQQLPSLREKAAAIEDKPKEKSKALNPAYNAYPSIHPEIVVSPAKKIKP